MSKPKISITIYVNEDHTHRSPDKWFVKLQLDVLFEKAGISAGVSCQLLNQQSIVQTVLISDGHCEAN